MTSKRKHELPVTPELVGLFLEEYAWLARSRHKRDRLAYRLIEWMAGELSYARMEGRLSEGAKKWADKVK